MVQMTWKRLASNLVDELKNHFLSGHSINQPRITVEEYISSKPYLLASISDKKDRQQIINWYYQKDRVLFFFAITLLCGIATFSVLIITGEYPIYIKASAAYSLANLCRRLMQYLTKHA
jgi:hypothetical protein